MPRDLRRAFECPPPLLPEKLGFDADELGDPEPRRKALDRLTAERERIGPVNLVAEQELAELDASREANVAEREELAQAIHRLRGSIGSLNREGRVRLLDAFEKVDAHFRSLFTTLFDGGQAHLELVESDDPLEAGLEIMAQPPGKRLQSLTLLSGGEQALTAVALIFALFLTNPAPICVLDEVDAPLDDANVERFCDLLDRMTGETDTRYLIVTHNAVTMSRMHRLLRRDDDRNMRPFETDHLKRNILGFHRPYPARPGPWSQHVLLDNAANYAKPDIVKGCSTRSSATAC